MAQFNFPGGVIDPNTTSGTELANWLSQWDDALNSNHLDSTGASRQPSYATAGMIYAGGSGVNLNLNFYNGTTSVKFMGIQTVGTRQGAPAYAFDSDGDSFLGYSADDVLQIYTGGALRMEVANDATTFENDVNIKGDLILAKGIGTVKTLTAGGAIRFVSTEVYREYLGTIIVVAGNAANETDLEFADGLFNSFTMEVRNQSNQPVAPSGISGPGLTAVSVIMAHNAESIPPGRRGIFQWTGVNELTMTLVPEREATNDSGATVDLLKTHLVSTDLDFNSEEVYAEYQGRTLVVAGFGAADTQMAFGPHVPTNFFMVIQNTSNKIITPSGFNGQTVYSGDGAESPDIPLNGTALVHYSGQNVLSVVNLPKEVSSNAQALAGTDNTTVISPKRLTEVLATRSPLVRLAVDEAGPRVENELYAAYQGRTLLVEGTREEDITVEYAAGLPSSFTMEINNQSTRKIVTGGTGGILVEEVNGAEDGIPPGRRALVNKSAVNTVTVTLMPERFATRLEAQTGTDATGLMNSELTHAAITEILSEQGVSGAGRLVYRETFHDGETSVSGRTPGNPYINLDFNRGRAEEGVVPDSGVVTFTRAGVGGTKSILMEFSK